MARKIVYRIADEIKAAVIADRKAGLTHEQVAIKHKLGKSTVSRIIVEDRAVNGPKPPRRAVVKARMVPKVEDVTRKPAENDNQPEVAADPILATNGRWAALADYAAQSGITTARAQQLWHKARAVAQ
jgi:hypothetical protein